ncbi:restriction endonuclease subunit S [Kushneria phosphatilytica]|uniref:Uncharacterized protein n=1 Tax=Kushneria phosphatilytica TaxID=657387 RepID=A0A1S1NUP0_9GAMM|nr:restriction endonuclease subunit S [Kushneria phosphatilytica]OHV07477.1 hypothetical protein BH688_14655 [Kushneria phosphatilytica]QEL09957.1 hypothetical protein FY550_01625 [Kushneria phosphatilytica]
MSFPQYPEYKNSGVEWLGEVPAHWLISALSRNLRCPVTDGPHSTPEFLGEGVPFLSVDGIQNGELVFENCRYVSEKDHQEFSKKSLPEKDDILMGKAASVGKVARVKTEVKFSIWSPLALIKIDSIKASPTFFEYALKSEEVQFQITQKSNSNTQLNIGMKDIPKLRVCFPPLSEQNLIAAFLDHETARIDALVEEQQRLIALLKEKRQAVISHAVTKGLDPDVPMKDSGVEWLGEVPAHWVRKRLKNVSPFITVGIVVNPSSYLAEEGLPFIYGGEIREGYIEVDKARKISLGDSHRNRKTMLEAGDVVTMRVGYPGVTAVVPPECEGGNCASVMLIKKGGYDSRWLCAVMNSRLIRNQVEMVQYGAAQKQFNISDAVEFWLFEPQVDEQASIADYIDRASTGFDQLVEEASKNMKLLKERRSALISAAVTGKIDVRGWTPPADSAPADQETRMEAV